MRTWLFSVLLTVVLVLFVIGCAGGALQQQSSTTSTHTGAVQPPPSLSVSASPAKIPAGSPATITWTSSHTTGISFSPVLDLEGDNSSLPLSGSAVVTPQQTTTYIATASGKGGNVTQSVTVTVGPALPSVALTASPGSILMGSNQAVTLSWTTQHCSSLLIDGIGAVSLPSGSVTVSPTATAIYTAHATGPGGTATTTAKVVVTAVSLKISPAAIAPGESAVLSWNSVSAQSITIDNGIGTVAVPSGQVTVNPNATTRYTATVIDTNGNASTATALLVVSQAGAGFLNIKHIIFFVQENRSFDNYFGMLGQYRAAHGLTDPVDGIPPGTALPDPSGAMVPSYHFQTVCHQNLPPGWTWAWPDYDNGKMDKFVISAAGFQPTIDPNGTRAMGYYDSSDLPYYYDLATQFATSDRFFSSVMASTDPNRMYLFAATSFGNIVPPTSKTIAGWKQPTIFDKLDQAGISWRYYYQDNGIFLAEWDTWNRDQGKAWNISHWYTDVLKPSTLPQVIFIERATQLGLDEHPGENLQTGAANSSRIINALLNSPAWSSSVLVLTYDESGGMYDHVPPVELPAPDNIPPPTTYGDFKHSGFRIPVVVVSPWVKPHFVSHVPRDLTSILKLIETRFGAQSLTARDAAADDMTEFFDFSSPAWLTPPTLAEQPTNGVCNMNLEKAPGF